jgi:Na+/melibiose symporter-like transporter
MKANPDKVKFSTKMFYAAGELPGGYLTTILNFFLLIFLTDWIGIPPGWAGAILFIGFVFDGITDPIRSFRISACRIVLFSLPC